MMEIKPFRYRSPESEALSIIAWQFRKVGKLVWDSCGEHTYDIHKIMPEYEVRRLVVYSEITQ